MTPLVSVIIATRNRSALLAQTLDALSNQEWPVDRLEIVVADNGSTDNTRAVVARHETIDGPVVRYIAIARPGKSHAVNAALAIAQGDVLAFTDDDVKPVRGWLRHVMRTFEAPDVDFMAGRILPLWEVPTPRWMSPALYGVLAVPDNGLRRLEITSPGADVIPIGANMAVRRAVIDRIGGLRVDLGKLEGTLRTGEDHEFFLRMIGAGFRGRYEPEALVYHWVPKERLDRDYFRAWLYQNGRDVARIEMAHRNDGRRLLRVPGYRWRQGGRDAATLLRSVVARDRAAQFGAAVHLRWLAGYLRESWMSSAEPAATHSEVSPARSS